MVFSSTIFLFSFLPFVLFFYMLAGHRLRNVVLLGASLFFYAWGENIYVLVMLSSILGNYIFGLLINRAMGKGRRGRRELFFGVGLNLLLLGFFKYANFIMANINALLIRFHVSPLDLPAVHLPIGISFFTFQAMSYLVDLYRHEVGVEKNPLDLALYISLFPQLIAGPIVRYHDIARSLHERSATVADVAAGIRRFIIGLGKKVLIANVLGRAADYLFSVPPVRLPSTLAWLGALAYTLQIYYDFSGYSDMAIGLGRIFGFHFPENFNYPYISRSIREFWRRWHISLSTWFRDYLYFPLGGSRTTVTRTYFNLLVVFVLCGLWHGANWTFVCWGLYHGLFLILERTKLGRSLARLPIVLQHGYAMLVVIIGWVFFRAEDFSHALEYLKAMFTLGRPTLFNSQIFLNLNNEFFVTLIIGLVGMAPFMSTQLKQISVLSGGEIRWKWPGARLLASGELFFWGAVLLYSVASIMGGSYNPFLYFRF